ncbi:hypothetical protein NKG99_20455 [Mesorhizobium sp. M1409]|uniref:hypothetical protein n=1 Tax=Mesorhizobium sp. M1409 TaxID=2957100 RepID=UPI00333DAADE
MTKEPQPAPRAKTGPDTFKTYSELNPGDDPVTKVVEEPVRATLVDISPREPYPTGSPPLRTWAQINGYSEDAVK